MLKCLKTVEITYLQAEEQQTRYCLTYLELWKKEQRYGWCFQDRRTTPKVNEHFQPLKANNKVCLVHLQCKLQQDRRS